MNMLFDLSAVSIATLLALAPRLIAAYGLARRG
jgi:hypothetical protein